MLRRASSSLACRLGHAINVEANCLTKGPMPTNDVGQKNNIVRQAMFGMESIRGLHCSEPVATSSQDGEEEREITNPKVLELADRIVELNMLEVSDLTELLKKRLNIQGGGVGNGICHAPMGGVPAGRSCSTRSFSSWMN